MPNEIPPSDAPMLILGSKIDEVAHLREPGYKEAIIKVSRKLTKPGKRSEVAYLISRADFAAIAAKYNPKDIKAHVLTATITGHAPTEASAVDIRTIMVKQVLDREKYPDIRLNSVQLRGRAHLNKKLEGRDPADCPGCEWTAIKTRISMDIMESAEKVPDNFTVITLWRGDCLDALDWYIKEKFPPNTDIVWVVDREDPIPELEQFQNKRPDLRISIIHPPRFEAGSKPLRVARLYDFATEGRFLRDIVLTVGDDVKAPRGTLQKLADRFNKYDVGTVSAYHEQNGKRANFSVEVPWKDFPISDGFPAREIDVTAGVAMMSFHMFRKIVWTESQPFIYTGRGKTLGNDTRLHATARNLGLKSYVLTDVVVDHKEP